MEDSDCFLSSGRNPNQIVKTLRKCDFHAGFQFPPHLDVLDGPLERRETLGDEFEPSGSGGEESPHPSWSSVDGGRPPRLLRRLLRQHVVILQQLHLQHLPDQIRPLRREKDLRWILFEDSMKRLSRIARHASFELSRIARHASFESYATVDVLRVKRTNDIHNQNAQIRPG